MTISIPDRVDAVIAATDIIWIDNGASLIGPACAIHGQLRQQHPNIAQIEIAIARLLTVKLAQPYDMAILRRECGKIERALWLRPTAENTTALAAWEASNEAWDAYAARFKAEAA